MKYLTIVFFAAAILIFGFRLHKILNKRPIEVFLTDSEGQQYINPEAFQRSLGQKHEARLKMQLLTLMVFIMPEGICPITLEEAPYWTRPKFDVSESIYNTLIFIPKDTDPDMAKNIANSCGLEPHELIPFSPGDPEGLFAQFGVFKILYSQETGVVFFERGSANREAFTNLENSIRTEIAKYKEY